MPGKKMHSIHEIGIQIPISKTSHTYKKNNLEEKYNYDLNNNNFDPTKSSPPNDFLIKLQKRMKMFEILKNV